MKTADVDKISRWSLDFKAYAFFLSSLLFQLLYIRWNSVQWDLDKMANTIKSTICNRILAIASSDKSQIYVNIEANEPNDRNNEMEQCTAHATLTSHIYTGNKYFSIHFRGERYSCIWTDKKWKNRKSHTQWSAQKRLAQTENQNSQMMTY